MLNRTTIMGRLTRDPELRRTGSGVAVTSFRIAVESDYKDGNGNKKTIYVDCQAWRTSAEYICKYFTKGRIIVVDGKLDLNEWTDKDSNKRSNLFILVDSAYFGDSKKDDGNQGGSYSGNGAGYSAPAAPAPSYGAQGGYNVPHAPQGGGYAGPNQWATPNGQSGNFAMLDDDDAQLPF